MPLTLNHLRRARGQPGNMPADVVAEVLVCVGKWVAGADKGVTLEDAFGVAVPPGGQPWFAILARERRDEAICKIAQAACPIGCVSEQADAALREIRRYAPTWRRRDQYRHDPPADESSIVFWLFEANRCGSIPDSADRIRKILSA
jgi:hypothetical protein